MLDVRVSRDDVRVPLALAKVQELAQHVLRWERCRAAALDITFISNSAIARLNRRHLGHVGTTDIVTFAHGDTVSEGPTVADIYIAPAVASANALAFGSGGREEIARLVIHGVLHALGMEHPDDESRVTSVMWRRQERWLARARRESLI